MSRLRCVSSLSCYLLYCVCAYRLCSCFQQSCFRGYRDYLKYALETYAVVQIQACVRRFISKCLVKRLQLVEWEKSIEEYAILCNSAATAIVSLMLDIYPLFQYLPHIMLTYCLSPQQTCFRGYRDFLRYLMISFSAVRVQACARGFLVRRRLKQEALEHVAATVIVSRTVLILCYLKMSIVTYLNLSSRPFSCHCCSNHAFEGFEIL